MNEEEAAKIIQKFCRNYLRTKRRKMHKSEAKLDENHNKEFNDKLHARTVLEKVNLFYKKWHSYLKKKNEIKKLSCSIDELAASLKHITSLEQCEKVETFIANDENIKTAKELHLQQLKEINIESRN